MRPHLILLLALVPLLFQSCKKEDSLCRENEIAHVGEVDHPATGTVGQPIEIEVRFTVKNGCGQFGRSIETSTGLKRVVLVQAQYIGCICTMDAPMRTTTYRFTPKMPGTHVVRFAGVGQMIEAIIEVSG